MNRQNTHTTNYDDFNKVFSYLHLYRASKKAQKNVGWKYSVQKYLYKRNINLANTRKQLLNSKYKSMGFYTFYRHERGKLRVIKSNHISERVVQKCLCDYSLVPILKRKLIYDNGATLKHKGCEFVLKRTKLFIRKAQRENKPIYALTMDFHSYFDNIDHDILIEEVSRYYTDTKLINLYTYFVKCFGEKGLGLGSQISQISAVYYTHAIDNLIKHKQKHKYYVRYMDDSVILDTSKSKLKETLSLIVSVCEKYRIIINEKKTMISKNSFSFLQRTWSIVKHKFYIKPKKDSFYRMMRKLKIFAKWYKQNKFSLENIKTSYNSWQSHFKYDSANNILKKSNIIYNNYIKELI